MSESATVSNVSRSIEAHGVRPGRNLHPMRSGQCGILVGESSIKIPEVLVIRDGYRAVECCLVDRFWKGWDCGIDPT